MTSEHPFGFGQERYLYAFVVAVMLFTVGGVLSGYEGVKKIIHPGTLTSPLMAFVVLGVAICLEGFSLRTAVSRSNAVRGKLSWGEFIRRAKAPELPVVLLEDTAALTGLAFALAGVTLAVITGNEAWDGAGSLAIGVLLCCVAAVLAVEMKSLLIGESASAEAEQAIVAALEDGPEVDRVIHLRTVHMGPESLLVGGQDRGPRRDDRGRDRGGHQCRRAAGARGRAHRRRHLPGTRPVPVVPGRRDRPRHPRRPAQRPAQRPALTPVSGPVPVITCTVHALRPDSYVFTGIRPLARARWVRVEHDPAC